MTNNTWPSSTLEDISDNLDNKRVPVSKLKRNKGNIPYYGATGIVDYVEDYIFDEELLLIGEDGADWSPGASTAYIINGKSWVNNHAHVLRITKANPNFVMNYLNYADLRQHTTGTTRGKLNKASLMNIKIPTPTLKIQNKVADILSSLDELIQKTDQVIQKSELLKKGLIGGLFDNTRSSNWKIYKLGDAARFIDYRGKTPTKVAEGVPLITAKNVRMGYIDREPREYIKIEDYDSWMTRGLPKKGDVLFTTEAPLGNIAQIDTDEKLAFAQRVIIMQSIREIDPTFLKYLLMSDQIQMILHSLSTGGTVKGIKAKILKQIEIPIPSITEQQKIAEIMTQCDRKMIKEKLYKNKLEILKDGLMQDIFNQKIQIN